MCLFETAILLDFHPLVRERYIPVPLLGIRRNDDPYYYWLALSKNFLTLSNQLLALGR